MTTRTETFSISENFPMQPFDKWKVRNGRGDIIEVWTVLRVFTEGKKRKFLAEIKHVRW